MFVGANSIGSNSKFVVHQFAKVWNLTKNTNRTGDCIWAGNNFIGRARNIITTRCRHIAKRYHQCFFFGSQFNLAPNGFRIEYGTTGRVNTQHNSFIRAVLAYFTNFFTQFIAANSFVGTYRSSYLATGINNRHFVSAVLFALSFYRHFNIVFHTHHRNCFCSLNACNFAHIVKHFVAVFCCINQPVYHHIIGFFVGLCFIGQRI